MEFLAAHVTGTNLPHNSMPVENAQVFVHRLDTFFKEFLLGGPQILGKVKQHVKRYELQGRGSLHAHCLLWVDDYYKPLLRRSISAAIPGIWNEESQCYDPPEDVMQRKLYDAVRRKQKHVCRPEGCLADGHCKYGFPFATRVQAEAGIGSNGTHQ